MTTDQNAAPYAQNHERSAVRKPEDDLELWKHHATFGGEDKNRMVVTLRGFWGSPP